MPDRTELKDDTRAEVITPEVIIPEVVSMEETSENPRQQKQGWLKGPLALAICCGAPLLLVGAIAFFGLSLGAALSGFLSLAVVLACPLGMYFMMRMMMNNKK